MFKQLAHVAIDGSAAHPSAAHHEENGEQIVLSPFAPVIAVFSWFDAIIATIINPCGEATEYSENKSEKKK